MRLFTAISIALLPLTLSAQEPAWSKPPKLVVGVVVDQMRPDYLYRYWDNFGAGGFKRLIAEGAFLRDAHYTYLYTKTGPGHASIYTGSTPSVHGIQANYMYDRLQRRTINCVADPNVTGVGSANALRSPVQLLATTLADEIERRTEGQSRTIGISRKDRSAILPIGRTGDAAYWCDNGGGQFVTSSWYGMKELPAWVVEFNSRNLPAKYLDRTWEPLLPLAKYHQALPDDNPYETPLRPGTKAAFPYPLGEWSKASGSADILTYTPWGNTLVTEMALAAITGEKLGADPITDLLAISYSAPDDLGHEVGPRAIEMEDMYIRLDQEIERLLKELDERVGVGAYTLFLTADHGVVDVPQYLRDLKGSAGYLRTDSLRMWIEDRWRARGSTPGPVVDVIVNGQIYLLPEAMGRAHELATLLLDHPIISNAVAVRELHATPGADERADRWRNSCMPQRSGELIYTLIPGYTEVGNDDPHSGTEHSTGWNYDNHVPVIFFGKGIKPAEVVRRTSVADIVHTMSMIIGCALPDAAMGEALPEVLR